MAGSNPPAQATAEEDVEAGPHTPGASKGGLSQASRRSSSTATSASSGKEGSLRFSSTKTTSTREGKEGEEEELRDMPHRPPGHATGMSVLSSVYTGVHSVIQDIEDRLHRMPKWQFHLLVGSLLFLLCALVLMTTITVVYGFGMTFPHISITGIQPQLPFPFMDAKGAIPINATLSFSNPNAFPATTKPTTIKIYALPERSPASLLASAHSKGLEFDAHETHVMESDFSIPNIGKAEGGPVLVQAVAGGKSSLMYTTSDTVITVKSLGFLPISRTYKAQCTILKEWAPGGKVLSDCWGRFV